MSASSNSSDSRVVVVTGGEGALGAAVGEAFVAAGYAVHCPGRGELDVSSPDSVKAFFDGLERIDVLVNNAGITDDQLLLKMTEASWDRVLDVNLSGASRCARAAVRGMIKRRCGSIINISSYSALVAPFGQVNYVAAKAGLIGFTKALAKEVGARGVCVNAVLPGFLESKMTSSLKPEVIGSARAEHVLGRFNTPGEAARFIVMIAEMSNVSGQVFQLDSRVAKW